GHTKCRCVAAAWIVTHFKTELPEDLFTATRDQAERSFWHRRQTFLPQLERRKGKLQRCQDVGWLRIDLTDVIDVHIAAMPNGDAVHRSASLPPNKTKLARPRPPALTKQKARTGGSVERLV